MESERVSVVYLSQKTDILVTWDRIDDLVQFMRELVEAKRAPCLNRDERNKIFDLGTRIERRAIEVIRHDTAQIVKEWEFGTLKPRELIQYRDNFRAKGDNAPTSTIRKAFYDSTAQFRKLLEEGSERQAALLVTGIENRLEALENMLTGDQELSARECDIMRRNLYDAAGRFCQIQEIPHVKHVGILRVAKNRGMSPESFLLSLGERIRDLHEALAQRHSQAYEAETKARRQAGEREMRELRERRIADELAAIKRRNPEAGRAAHQFLENVKLGNSGAAQHWLNQIQRLDGGIPPLFQEEWGKLLRRATTLRSIPA